MFNVFNIAARTRPRTLNRLAKCFLFVRVCVCVCGSGGGGGTGGGGTISGRPFIISDIIY